MIKRKANLPAADSGTSRHLIACELVSNRVAISVVLKLEAVVDGGLRGGHGYQTGEKCRVVVQVCVKALRLHNTQRASSLPSPIVPTSEYKDRTRKRSKRADSLPIAPRRRSKCSVVSGNDEPLHASPDSRDSLLSNNVDLPSPTPHSRGQPSPGSMAFAVKKGKARAT